MQDDNGTCKHSKQQWRPEAIPESHSVTSRDVKITAETVDRCPAHFHHLSRLRLRTLTEASPRMRRRRNTWPPTTTRHWSATLLRHSRSSRDRSNHYRQWAM